MSHAEDAAFHHAQIAKHNAALPDGDPRKFTRADVDAVDEAATFLPDQMWDLAKLVRGAAAKIAGLLPPE